MKLARIEKVCRRNGEGFACKVAINRAKTLIADSQPWILRIHTTTMYGVGRNQDIRVRMFLLGQVRKR